MIYFFTIISLFLYFKIINSSHKNNLYFFGVKKIVCETSFYFLNKKKIMKHIFSFSFCYETHFYFIKINKIKNKKIFLKLNLKILKTKILGHLLMFLNYFINLKIGFIPMGNLCFIRYTYTFSTKSF